LNDSRLPWSRAPITVPFAHARAIVAHVRGTFGWQEGDWVGGQPFGRKHHKGIDVIGCVGADGVLRPLDRLRICAPADGWVEFVGADEDAKPSIVLRHSWRGSDRFRITFFGDLRRVFVRGGERLRAGDSIATAGTTPTGLRFFHFGVGYRLTGKRVDDVFVDPFALMPGIARSRL
jgi:murein DD-endopeptidase MepM/ murein hydrolase activator NlpD